MLRGARDYFFNPDIKSTRYYRISILLQLLPLSSRITICEKSNNAIYYVSLLIHNYIFINQSLINIVF